MSTIFDTINVAQLEILGVNKEKLYVCAVILSMLMIWFVVYYLLIVLQHKNYTFVLTYITSSLIIVTVTSLTASIHSRVEFIKVGFQTVVLFGIAFVIYIIYKVIKDQMKSV